MSLKRKRVNESNPRSIWINASNWIENEGGFIHKACTFSLPERSVRVTTPIKKGTLIMKIPKSCLITLNTAEESPIGPHLFRAVHSVDESKIHHNKNDVLLALFLASLATDHDGESSSLQSIADKSAFYYPYLSTLPADTSYDNLPRRWPDEQLERLLTGTSLLNRARKDREGVKNDYALVAKSWENQKSSRASETTCSFAFPALSKFDQMLAAVASRGFASLGNDGLDAMVPFLDLLDHRRGAKDVTYVRSEEDGSIQVTADRDLEANSTVHDTYGAKGNAQLLTRYGFCLEHNIEPDGSSNDVLEFVAKPDQPPVELRAGPKSYTFGGFVKGLEMFHEFPENGHKKWAGDDQKDGDGDDMEAFLNSCDDEGLGECGMYEDVEKGDTHADDNGNDDEMIMTECHALDAFIKALENAQKSYTLQGKELDAALQNQTSTPEHFCAILVQSEMRTNRLHIHAAKAIKKKLQKESMVVLNEATDEDSELVDAQTNELMVTFLKIRYPFLDI